MPVFLASSEVKLLRHLGNRDISLNGLCEESFPLVLGSQHSKISSLEVFNLVRVIPVQLLCRKNYVALEKMIFLEIDAIEGHHHRRFFVPIFAIHIFILCFPANIV